MKSTIGTVLEAAEIRQEQWDRIGNGAPVYEVVEELHEVAGNLSWTDDRENEAHSIAEEQGSAIAAVRTSLPAKYHLADLETLAGNAMCIWEHVLEVQRNFKHLGMYDEPLHSWLGDGEGAFAARDGCWKLAGWAEFAYNQFEYKGGKNGYDAFDWDFIPEFVEQLYYVCSSRGISPADVDEEYVTMAVDAVIDA